MVGTDASLRSSLSGLTVGVVEFGNDQRNGPCGHSGNTWALICTESCGGRTFDTWNIVGVEKGKCSVGA